MSDCAYGSYSSLSWRDAVNMSGCAYGSSGTICQVMSIVMAFLFLVRVGLANQSRLIIVGAAVSFSQGIGHGHGRLQCGRQDNGRHEH